MSSFLSKALRSRKDNGDEKSHMGSSRSCSNTSQGLEDISAGKSEITGCEVGNVDGTTESNHSSRTGTESSHQTANQHEDLSSPPVVRGRRRTVSWKSLSSTKRPEIFNLTELFSGGPGNSKPVRNKDLKYPAFRSLRRRLSSTHRSRTTESEKPDSYLSVVGPQAPSLPLMTLSSSPLMKGIWPENEDAVSSTPLPSSEGSPEKKSVRQGLGTSTRTSEVNSGSNSWDNPFRRTSRCWTDQPLMSLSASPRMTDVSQPRSNSISVTNDIWIEITNSENAESVTGKAEAGHTQQLASTHQPVGAARARSFSGLPGHGGEYDGTGFEFNPEFQTVSGRTSTSHASPLGSMDLKHTLGKSDNALSDMKYPTSTGRRRPSSQSYEADAEDNTRARPIKRLTPIKAALQSENTEEHMSCQGSPTTPSSKGKSPGKKLSSSKRRPRPLPYRVDSGSFRAGNGRPSLGQFDGDLSDSFNRDRASGNYQRLNLGVSGLPPSTTTSGSSFEDKGMPAPSQAITGKTVRWSDEHGTRPAPAASVSLSEGEKTYLRAAGYYNKIEPCSSSSGTGSNPILEMAPIRSTSHTIRSNDLAPPYATNSRPGELTLTQSQDLATYATYEEEPCRPFVAARLPIFSHASSA